MARIAWNKEKIGASSANYIRHADLEPEEQRLTEEHSVSAALDLFDHINQEGGESCIKWDC